MRHASELHACLSFRILLPGLMSFTPTRVKLKARRMNALSLCLYLMFVTAIKGDFVDLPQDEPIRSLAEEETVLPCLYQATQDNVVVQVTWYKETPDGKKQIITAHHVNGQTAFGSWARRVRFKNSEPTKDSSLVIMSTDVSDEGTYICHISTFPSGNFDREMSLIVWTIPISSLDPVIVEEGQDYRLAASCRSVARPPPHLTWDTDLNGQSTNRTSESGAVSSHYSLHPLRSMNGKKLDCLVWHPTFKTPRRITNKLEVHFPPHADVSGYNEDWFVGLENAALRCVSGGNPTPHSFTWIRMDGEMPKGVISHPNGTLTFGRPLNSSDGGVYQCVARNKVGVGKAEVEINVKEAPQGRKETEDILMIIVGGVASGLLILMLVVIVVLTCHHKRKNKRLKRELTEKKEEISTLSRQASIRRVNSVSTDARGANEENIPLRVEGTLRTSISSMGEQAAYRDSRSTISGGRGANGGYDSLGRPVLYNNSRRGRERPLDIEEESRLRVETYVRNSALSLQETRFHPPLQPSTFPKVQSTDILMRQMNGGTIISSDGGSRPGSVAKHHQQSPVVGFEYPVLTDDEDEVDEGLGGPASQEHPDDQDSETNCSQVSETLSFMRTNGTLRSKMQTGSPLDTPHASLIHKAHIV